MKTKRMITGILVICLVFALGLPAFAKEQSCTDKYGRNIVYGTDKFSVKYNGDTVVFPDAQPYVDSNNRTLVPIRFVSETMGADVSWRGETSTAVIAKGDLIITITIGESSISITKDGKTTRLIMDTQAVLKDERTCVPFRYIGEALGAWVGYSDLLHTAQIYDDVLTPEEISRLHGYYDMTWQEFLDSDGSNSPYSEEEWIDSKPWIQHFTGTGTYGFENANEWILRNPNNKSAFKGSTTGKIWVKGVNADVELAKLVTEEAIKGVESQFAKDGLVEADLRTDLSGIFASRHASIGTAYVRGILTMDLAEDANISAIQSKYGVSGIQAGEKYSGDVEVCVRINPTNGYVYCVNISSLK